VIIVVPEVIPVTTPPATVPTDGVLLLQVPPDGVLVNVVVLPTPTTIVPDINVGTVFTVTTSVAVQPDVVLYTAIVAVPALTPVTNPELVGTVATLLLLLVQYVPSVVANVVVAPTHMAPVPVSGVGVAKTVTAFVAAHPEPI
jgi:hypothetical protein